MKEYENSELLKRAVGRGIWRLPPAFDGRERMALPRFTALNPKERVMIRAFFNEWARLAVRALLPGGHVFLPSNAFISQLVFGALVEGGLEFRGEVIRLVRTLRGGDRPKNAEEEFAGVCSLPSGGYEPWGILRKPLPRGLLVSDCLRQYGTGGLRRTMDDKPFADVIKVGRTPRAERAIANHPSLKPQALLRRIVWTALPLGQGIVCDPFMGSGSTVAAAEAIGYQCIGIERHLEYIEMARVAVPRLAVLAASEDTRKPPARE